MFLTRPEESDVFRHCVMFKWTDQVTSEAKAALSTGLDSLAELAVVQSYIHGPDAGVSDGNWDYAVVADFADVDDYRAYSADAGHQELIAELLRPNIAARAAIQYEY